MPRKPRFIIPGLPQHVIIRGVNRNKNQRGQCRLIIKLQDMQERENRVRSCFLRQAHSLLRLIAVV